MLVSYLVICLEGKEKQGELDIPREGRKLGQWNKISGLLFGYFTSSIIEYSPVKLYHINTFDETYGFQTIFNRELKYKETRI